jgi:uncharacterized protein DUF3159
VTETVQLDASALLQRLGGRRGVLDGALPPLVFLAVHAGAGFWSHGQTALRAAVLASVVAALALVVLRLRQREPLKAVLRGLAGLGVAVAFALWTGEARDYFLPGIWVDGAYAAGLASSVMVGRPMVGIAYAALHRMGRTWRHQPALRRVLTLATWGWALVYATRAGVQAYLYAADRPELLGLGKLLLGWPLTVVAVVLTLGAARRARTGHCPTVEPPAR